jgi:SAM-dependent methyltransferase
VDPWDERIAAGYDATSPEMFATEVLGPTVDFLAAFAGDRPALEFAVGTGRVALPLSARGVEVRGIELSEPMAAQLRAKPGADRVPVTIGDMSTVEEASLGHGRFGLVYLVYNTISNLLTQQGQVDCFRNAAAHLAPGGHFVIEVFVPALRRLPPGERFVPYDVSPGHVGVDEYDVVNQRLVSHHWWRDGPLVGTVDSSHRYAWPAEYDLMAQLAGLDLVERWADWHRREFTAESASHVSVWRKPG